MTWILAHIWPLSYLSVALIDDVLYRKFHNKVFLSLLALSSIYIFFYSPLTPLESFFGFLAGAFLFIPLVLIGVVGAGDMKFMAAFGVLVGHPAIFSTTVYALLWGAGMGAIKAILSGKVFELLTNLKTVTEGKKPKASTRIPFTAAIFLGWLTFKFHGGAF